MLSWPWVCNSRSRAGAWGVGLVASGSVVCGIQGSSHPMQVLAEAVVGGQNSYPVCQRTVIERALRTTQQRALSASYTKSSKQKQLNLVHGKTGSDSLIDIIYTYTHILVWSFSMLEIQQMIVSIKGGPSYRPPNAILFHFIGHVLFHLILHYWALSAYSIPFHPIVSPYNPKP